MFRILLHFLLVLSSVSRAKEYNFDLDSIINNIECRPIDIHLYTWSGPDFQSGECWHQGHRFANGAVWGRLDLLGSPYCVCDQGKIRIFYNKQASIAAAPLTLLPSNDNTLPTSKDLFKWPVQNFPIVRQRIVYCTKNRTNLRIRSKDGCVVCKCSRNEHWLCRKASSLPRIQTKTNKTQQISKNSYIDTYRVDLYIRTSSRQSKCSLDSVPKFCILIERLYSLNINKKISRYIELPRETSWIDYNACTRCSCRLDGQLKCEFIHESCSRPCLLHKTHPVSIMYYFPSDSQWLTSWSDQCRSCRCINGQRKCINCEQILNIDIRAGNNKNKNNQQQQADIGEHRLLSSVSTIFKARPCLLETGIHSHRLIFPGQLIWFEEHCYFCSRTDNQLVKC